MFRKPLPAFTAVLIVLASLFTPTALASPLQTITQADRVIIGTTTCTIGYVDKVSRTAYTALHCAKAAAGERAFVNGTAVGYTLHDSYTLHGGNFHRGDVQAIRLYSDTRIGGNPYTGDAVYPYENLRVGDTTCSFSRKQNTTLCGHITNLDDGVIMTNHGGIAGDSGGPIWRVDDAGRSMGSIGVYSFGPDGVLNADSRFGFMSLTSQPCNPSTMGVNGNFNGKTLSPGCGERADAPGVLAPIHLRQPSRFENGTATGASSLDTDPMVVVLPVAAAYLVTLGLSIGVRLLREYAQATGTDYPRGAIDHIVARWSL